MLTKIILPLLAIAGLSLAVWTVRAQSKEVRPAPPVASPATAPFAANVPGAGLVEPSTEFIDIGTNVSGVVTSVLAKAGDRVKAGDPLFVIDERALKAEIDVRKAALASAKVEIERLRARPRPEELPAAEARVQAERSIVEDLQDQLQMWENLPDKRAVSAEEFSRRRFAVLTAQARLSEADSNLGLLKAGTWKPDLDIAEAQLASAQADVRRLEVELDRYTIRAPVECDVLKVNVRAGEFAPAGIVAEPFMILGETKVLHVRVDIDENDAWRVKKGAPGVAYVRGNSALKTPIRFVRFEPYVIPKRSLTGASGERVDTRVLQVIFEFDRRDLPVFVGQQMDVFIESDPVAGAKFGVDPDQADRDLRNMAPVGATN